LDEAGLAETSWTNKYQAIFTCKYLSYSSLFRYSIRKVFTVYNGTEFKWIIHIAIFFQCDFFRKYSEYIWGHSERLAKMKNTL
jgi:hypothetical protein